MVGPSAETFVIRGLKEKVATAHRILYRLGLADYLGHVSARIPDREMIVIKGRGWFLGSLSETGLQHIITVDLEGRPLGREKLPPPLETKMHTCIYKARSDVGSVVHTHQPLATAFGLSGRQIIPVHINAGGASAEVVAGGIPIFDRPDLINNDKLGEALAKALGGHGACHLSGHGIVVVGSTVEEATLRAIEIEMQAKLNLIASLLGELKAVPRDSLRTFVQNYVKTGEGLPPAYVGAWRYYEDLVPLKRQKTRSRIRRGG